ncbi:uncharacterized protein LOC115259145 [Aedes albopictus]|uniref:Uncharacterized protein n=1 Tax=Aedes albopictus TaxID=7160 RepID=A0ABM2A5K2_AEDAL
MASETSKVSTKIPKLNKKVGNKCVKETKSAKSSNAVKSTSRMWSYFSKRQPESIAILDKQMSKNSHQLGQIPAYLKERSRTFTINEEDVSAYISIPKSCAALEVIPTHTDQNEAKNSDTKILQKSDMSRSVSCAKTQTTVSIFDKFTVEHQKDLEKCAESRKELEVQIDDLRQILHKPKLNNHPPFNIESDSVIPFLNVFLQCVSNHQVSAKVKYTN